MTEPVSRTVSGYTGIDQTDDPGVYIRRLDTVGAGAFWRAVKRRTYLLLGLREGDRVLDVGCGTGDDVRALSRLVGRGGTAIGIDTSTVLVTEARRRTEGTGLPVNFHLSDVNHLGFLDGIFDGCRAERLFQHLDRPERALSEMIRVVRSAAYVVVVEPDYGTLVIVGADRTVTRKILDYRCTHFRSGRIGRDLFAMYKSQGLEEVALRLLTFVCTNIALGGERALLRRYLDEARQAGVVTEMEGAYWLRDLEAAGQAGIYRHAITVFLVRGKKP